MSLQGSALHGDLFLSAYHWKPGGIGMALAARLDCDRLAQVPAGAIIDGTYWKRAVRP